MLESKFTFDDDGRQKEGDYDLVLRRCSNWSTSKRRILVIQQTVDGRDLKARAIMGDKATDILVKNVIKHARQIAYPYTKDNGLPEAAYAVINFNQRKHLHLPPGPRKEAEQEFAHRTHRLIRKLKPTHVLVSGDEAMIALWPEVEHPRYKRGWVHQLKSGPLDLKVVSTLDLSRLMEKQGQFANLLGFFCRHFAYLMLNRNPHDLSHVKASPRYVDTIEKFDLLMKRFDASEECGIDTETRNLSVLHNKIYTIQFCMNQNPEAGYVLAVDHPLCHWTKEERRYIKQELRKRFGAKEGPLLVMFNGMFDLRIIRRQLQLPIIWLPVWEITAGEHLLDENIVDLRNFGAKPGNLRAIFCSYGNDHYFNAAFTKEDRTTTGTTDPSDKNFLMYASMDVVSLLAMKAEQIKRASKIKIADRPYEKYFMRHMLHQMSDTAHQLSHLREDGSKIDRKYLRALLKPDSQLRAEAKRIMKDLRAFPEVQEANRQLLAESGFKAGGLFGAKTQANWVFRMNKPDHKRKLFFDVMGLPAVSKTDTGQDAIDKTFINTYKDRNRVVAAYGEYQEIEKLISTYVRGWYKKLTTNLDSATDDHLRPDYSFFDVVTGRLASKGPNLQNIPTRGKLSKIIKRMFVGMKGYLLIRYDYSAHEVRVWSIASGDPVLAGVFKIGQKLRQEWIVNPSDEVKARLKKDGDVHIQNVKRFFNKDVEKSDPLRDAVKAVVFGTLYGKSAKTLGEDTKASEISVLKGNISTHYKITLTETDPAKFKAAEKALKVEIDKLQTLMEDDREAYAQGIIDKMFGQFKKGAAWTNKMQELAETQYYVYSPIGRRRYMPAALSMDRQIVNQQVRRGSNAPIQGLASEIGVTAGRCILEDYYASLPKLKKMLGIEKSNWAMRIPFNRTVHDANYYAVPYEMVLPFIHILQYQATYGVTKRYKDNFGIDFTVEPEVEIEVGGRDDHTHKWDWSLNNLIDGLKEAIKDTDEMGLLEGTPEGVLTTIMQPWKNKELRKYMQTLWPLLGVKKLDAQMDEALLYAKKPTKEDKPAAKPPVDEKAKMSAPTRIKRKLKEKATQ